MATYVVDIHLSMLKISNACDKDEHFYNIDVLIKSVLSLNNQGVGTNLAFEVRSVNKC